MNSFFKTTRNSAISTSESIRPKGAVMENDTGVSDLVSQSDQVLSGTPF